MEYDRGEMDERKHSCYGEKTKRIRRSEPSKCKGNKKKRMEITRLEGS